MSNGKCSEEEDEILRNHDAFLAEPTLDSKVMKLGEHFRDGRLSTVRGFASIRRLLPWRAWMLPALGSIGVLGFVALIWGASAFSKDVTANKQCAEEAKSMAVEAKAAAADVRSEFTEKLKPVSEASAVANAKLDMLLESRGMGGPSRGRIRRSAVSLGLVPDSSSQDSAPPGP